MQPTAATALRHDAGDVCWIDLATRDLPSARRFYEMMFGWLTDDFQLRGGRLTRLRRDDGAPFGSMYQMHPEAAKRGTPSHWLPYVRVGDLDAACARVPAAGGEVVVRAFDAGLARVAVVVHAGDAQIGLWEAK